MASRPVTRFGPAFFPAIAYVVTTGACVWLLKHPLADAATAIRAVVSLLPMIPISLAIRGVVRIVLRGDELQRQIDLQAIAVSSVAVGLGTLTLGLLIKAQVIAISGLSALIWVFPALWLGYGLARLWAARRY